jgi:hypothetical protein
VTCRPRRHGLGRPEPVAVTRGRLRVREGSSTAAIGMSCELKTMDFRPSMREHGHAGSLGTGSGGGRYQSERKRRLGKVTTLR